MFGIKTLFKPTVPYSSLASYLYDRYIAPAIQKQNQLLCDTVFKIDDLPNGSNVLDIGCGSGSLVHDLYFRNPTFQLTGVDLSKEQIQRARHRVKNIPANINFLIANAEALPFPDESFDFIVSVGMLKHIPNMRKALEESTRVLKPGGKMFIIEADKDASEERIKYFVGETAFPSPVKKIWYGLYKKHVAGKSINMPTARKISEGLQLDDIHVKLTPRVPAFMIIGEKYAEAGVSSTKIKSYSLSN